MAQIREFESTTESYFILDGVSYPKVYEAMLDNGYSDTKIKLVGTNRDTTPLVFSTQYTNIRVDGDSFDTAFEAISRLNQIVFSKGGGSGTGGATNVITEDSDTVAFTGNGTAGTPLKAEVKSDGLDYIPLTGTEEGKPVTGPIEVNIEEPGYIGYLGKGEESDIIGFGIKSVSTYGFSSIGTTKNNLEMAYQNHVGDGISFSVCKDGILLYDRIFEKGLVAESYYGVNYTDNTYVQKKYVDDLMDARIPEPPASGTFTLQSVDGVLTWI